jgi:hypothetical protein
MTPSFVNSLKCIEEIQISTQIIQAVLSNLASTLFVEKEYPLDIIKRDPLSLFLSYGHFAKKFNVSQTVLYNHYWNAYWLCHHWSLPQVCSFITDKDGVLKKGYWAAHNRTGFLQSDDVQAPILISSQQEADQAIIEIRRKVIMAFTDAFTAEMILQAIPMKVEF